MAGPSLRRPILIALAIGCAAASVAVTQSTAAAAPPFAAAAGKSKPQLRDVAATELAPQRLLPPPPSDPTEAAAELAEVRRVIAQRTPDRLAAAKWDDAHEDASLYAPTLGARFDLKALPATAELMAIVQTDASLAGKGAKGFFARKRPWAVDATIPTCDPGDKPTTSYPSGHAMIGYSTGLVLAELMPDKAQAILARAQDYAFSRVVCGSHFPSDTRASQTLSAHLVATLMANADFRAKLEAARAELKAAQLAP